MQRISNETKARKALQQLDGKMQKFGFRSHLELQSLVESILDPKTPCYEKAIKLKVASSINLRYYNTTNSSYWHELANLEKALASVLAKQGYLEPSCITTPQEHKLLGSTVWPAIQVQRPLILADHTIFTLKWEERGRLPEIANKSGSELREGIARILALGDGESVDVSTMPWQPKFVASLKNGELTVSVKPKIDLESVKTARKLMMRSYANNSAYAGTESRKEQIFISIEPLGPDGNTVRNPRVLNPAQLETLAKDDPRLEKLSHEEILAYCCESYELKENFKLKQG